VPALAIAVVLIAAPDSLNPSLIVAAVFLTLGANPIRRSLVFAITAFAVTLAGGLAIALGLGDLILSLLPKLSRTVKYDVTTAVGSAVLMGAGIAGVELLTAFPYFAAIAMVVGASVSGAGKVFLLILYNVVYVLPLIGIVVVRATMGDKGAELLVPVSDWIETHWPVVAAPVAGVAGAALTVYGIVQLVS